MILPSLLNKNTGFSDGFKIFVENKLCGKQKFILTCISKFSKLIFTEEQHSQDF